MKERYDLEENRANDIKEHDNKNHTSKHSNDVRLLETEVQLGEVEPPEQ